MKNKSLLIFTLTAVIGFLWTCGHKKASAYKYNHAGYYYRLLRFEEQDTAQKKWQIAKLAVVFKTQADSVFWDSYNNLNDNFYVSFSSSDKDNSLEQCASLFTLHDSVCMLVKPAVFYKEQFNSAEVPFFSKTDSVVKINFKIKELITTDDFAKIRLDLEKKEMGRLVVYFGSREDVANARDSSGFYWVEKPEPSDLPAPQEGDLVSISYQGSFLNGRFLERSAQNFDLIYGTPDQLLKGINYVIGRIKVGQNAKIILPSRLAFGEKGSSNGTVPPFTPLVYEIKINSIKHK